MAWVSSFTCGMAVAGRGDERIHGRAGQGLGGSIFRSLETFDRPQNGSGVETKAT